jgi:hypothetical protein
MSGTFAVNPTTTVGQQLTINGTFNVNGTIASGTWNGAVIGAAYGGAGTVSGIMKANGSGTVSAASAGTDYVAPPTVAGPYCTNFGYGAGNVGTNTGNYCTYIGYGAGALAHTGGYNLGFGANALYTNITGGYCVAIGANALYNIAAVDGCIGIGYAAGYNNVTVPREFYLNNVMQGSYYSDQTCSLLYGTFAASAGIITNQQLTVNGVLNVNSAAYVNANIGANGGYNNTFTSTFSGPGTTVSPTWILSRINNTITISVSGLGVTSTTAAIFTSNTVLPAAYRPGGSVYVPITANIAGVGTPAYIQISPSGTVYIYLYTPTSGNFPSGGTVGWYGFTATYNV